MLRSVVVCVCVYAALPAIAATRAVHGRSIKELVSGAHVEIDAPLGNKIPVQFSADGKMSSSAPHLAGYLGSPNDIGHWWVKGDELCSQWERWLNREIQCLRLTKEGSRIFWVNQDGRAGTASIVSQAKQQVAAAPHPLQAKRVVAAAAGTVPPEAAAPAMKPSPPPPATALIASAWAAESVASPPPTNPPLAAKPSAPAPPMPAARPEAMPAAPAPAIAIATSSAPAKVPRAAAPSAGDRLFHVARVDASDVLFVRAGPSADHSALGVLMPDTREVRITGECRSRWCPVAHQNITGWVNRAFLEPDGAAPGTSRGHPARVMTAALDSSAPARPSSPKERANRDAPDAPRTCLSDDARELLETIEDKFGPVELVSTCRPGATIAGTGRPSRHASGNAIDFNAGDRKAAIVAWLAANHHDGGTMTYGDKDHIHADIGPHFVSLAARDRATVQAATARDWSESRMSLWGPGGRSR